MVGSLRRLRATRIGRCVTAAARFAPALVLALPLVLLPVDATAASPKPPPVVVNIVDSGGTCTGAFCYQSATLAVRSGTTVVWRNMSTSDHTVTRCTMAACGVSGGTGRDRRLSSPVIASGGTYRFTFHSRGTYVYYCTIHGFDTMHGGVTVRRTVITVS
jgi:plastocyanin